MQWLPDPVLNETREHYKSYSEVKGTDTNESDRPTLTAKPTKEKGLNIEADAEQNVTQETARMLYMKKKKNSAYQLLMHIYVSHKTQEL